MSINITVRITGLSISGLMNTYNGRKPGDVVALLNSDNLIEVAVVNGNAAQQLGVRTGESVELILN